METEEFCDKFCPIPMRWIEFPRIDNEYSVDCDLEYEDCPFKDVDFSKVTEHSTFKEWTARILNQEVCPKCDGRGFIMVIEEHGVSTVGMHNEVCPSCKGKGNVERQGYKE